jgi:hypothetical protein
MFSYPLTVNMQDIAHFCAAPPGALEMWEKPGRDSNNAAPLVGAFAAGDLEINRSGL